MADIFQDCSLTGGITRDCKVNLTAGTKDPLALLNLQDIVNPLVIDVNQRNVVTGITKKFGTKAFLFTGINNSNQPVNTTEKGTYKYTDIHALTFVAWKVDPEAARAIEDFRGARIVSIYKDENGFYRIQGSNGGMELLTSTQTVNDEETGGAYNLELEGRREQGQPLFLAVYDYTNPENPVYDEGASDLLFNELFEKPSKAVSAVSLGNPTEFTVVSTADMTEGMEVSFSGFDGTLGDAVNGNSFAVTITSTTTFTIALDSTALANTVTGLIQ